jgi:hypothetical protein
MVSNVTDLDERRQVIRDNEATPDMSATSADDKLREELSAYLIGESGQREWAARRKSILAHLLFGTAIAASALGTMNPMAGWLIADEWTSILAAIPGMVLLTMNTFKYEERFKWHKLKQLKLEAVQRALIFEGKPSKRLQSC